MGPDQAEVDAVDADCSAGDDFAVDVGVDSAVDAVGDVVDTVADAVVDCVDVVDDG